MTEILKVNITNPQKIVYPKDKISKFEICKYYEKVASLMLPFLEKRLLSVIRCHENINGEKFFKKHPTTEGDLVSSFDVGGDKYFYVKDKRELVFQSQMGSLEFHTWGSRIDAIDRPDVMVFDLDPSEDVRLEKLKDGVCNLKSVLDELHLKSFLKTSGGKGYHIVVPFSHSKNWENFSEFSKDVALLLEARWPKLFTSNIRKDSRHGRIFVDYLRNKKGATCVAPYSLRARAGAPVSCPISWKNLEKISPNQVKLKNIDKFLTNPWVNFFAEKQIMS